MVGQPASQPINELNTTAFTDDQYVIQADHIVYTCTVAMKSMDSHFTIKKKDATANSFLDKFYSNLSRKKKKMNANLHAFNLV